MAPTIDVAFVEEYNSDVHLKFQQLGSRLMNMTRKGTVQAKSVYWQIFGSLVAQQKTRNQPHNFQDPEHTRVKADMNDWYVPTLVDDLDLLKLNIDEKNTHVSAHVAALGRKTDQVLLDVMYSGANAEIHGDAGSAFGYDAAMGVVTAFNVNEVPDDGNRFCALHPYQWAQFLKVPEFANADYVGQDALPFKGGMSAKLWMGTLWMPLPNAFLGDGVTVCADGTTPAANVARGIAWHRSVVGHGVNKEISTDWDWENTYSAWSCVSSMSLGAAVLEDVAVMQVQSLSPKPGQ
ncbi:phage capsid protein [Rhodobacter lacus]|uniref:Phage capsid protein n=1 Tax=Rhodobacter lacus TaxID=1641972 RepID=A0ABW5ADS8_9RHOB